MCHFVTLRCQLLCYHVITLSQRYGNPSICHTMTQTVTSHNVKLRCQMPIFITLSQVLYKTSLFSTLSHHDTESHYVLLCHIMTQRVIIHHFVTPLYKFLLYVTSSHDYGDSHNVSQCQATTHAMSRCHTGTVTK